MADATINSKIQKGSSVQRVILHIGQSFVPGREPMANLGAAYQGALPNVFIYNGSGFEVLNSTLNNNQYVGVNGPPVWAPSNEYGYTFYLGKDLATHYTNQTWMGAYGLGATYLGQANAPTWLSTATGSFCDTLFQHIINMKNTIEARGQSVAFDVIWDQGYADATTVPLAAAYAINLENFITKINGYFVTLKLRKPFWYIIKLAVNYAGLTDPATIRAAQVSVTAADTTSRRLIDIDAASLQGGTGHPDNAGNIYIANAILTSYVIDHP